MNKELEENRKMLEENKKTIEEMRELKDQIDDGIATLKSTAKESMVTIAVRAVVAACASNLVDKLAGAFLPKNLRGAAKIGTAAGTFLLPEIIGNFAATRVENILQEEE